MFRKYIHLKRIGHELLLLQFKLPLYSNIDYTTIQYIPQKVFISFLNTSVISRNIKSGCRTTVLFMIYKYFLNCSQQIEENSLRRGNRTYGHQCMRPTLYLLHHSRLNANSYGFEFLRKILYYPYAGWYCKLAK